MLRLTAYVPIARVSKSKVKKQIEHMIHSINELHERELGRKQTHETTLLSVGLIPIYIAHDTLNSSDDAKTVGKFDSSTAGIAFGLYGGDLINILKDEKDLSSEKRRELEESRDWALNKAKSIAEELDVLHIFNKAMNYSMVYENWEDAQMEKLRKGVLSKDLERIISNYDTELELNDLKTLDFDIEDIYTFNPKTYSELTHRRLSALYQAAFRIGAETWFNDTSLKKYAESTDFFSKVGSGALQLTLDDGKDLKDKDRKFRGDWYDRKTTPMILQGMKHAIDNDPDFYVDGFFSNPKKYRHNIEEGIEDMYALARSYFSLLRKDYELLGAFKDLIRFGLSKQLKEGYNEAMKNVDKIINISQ
ncbi:MAG: hypothetical protein JSW73_03365 [Candidatus Woesearchaeota archaeon]|nr:MAG: hypothetical protein JSW73_03365 [Candidatus Woesearchaeota archaeon]